MNVFPVWIQRAGNTCRVRVNGAENAKWLLAHLSQSFVFKTSEPMKQEEVGFQRCTFRVAHSAQISCSRFERLLAAIPGVQLALDPELESDSVNGGSDNRDYTVVN